MKFFSGLLIGIGTGTLVTLLYAPKSGRETRRYIRRRVDRGREVIERGAAKVHRVEEDIRDRSRKTIKQAEKALTGVAHAGRSVASALL